jgi:branched-chain amino acid transport system substrate-binding protein
MLIGYYMKKKLFVLAIAILITLSTFAILPTISSRHVKTISIGVVLPNQGTFDIFEPVFEEIIEPDINAYVDSLPRLRFVPNVRFEFLLEHGGGNTATHLEKVQYFASIGVDMIIGGFWSSQANASLSYMNENNMLLISPSSTDPGLAIADDVLYRLAIPDDMQAPVMADMILSKGIYNIIVLRNTNPYADWMYPAFEAAYIGKGGWIQGDFRYADENVTTCLGLADALASTITSDGVLLLGFEGEAANITNAVAASYANINSVPWFGSETTAKSHYILDNSGNNATHLKLYSTLSVPYNSTKYWEMVG